MVSMLDRDDNRGILMLLCVGVPHFRRFISMKLQHRSLG